MDMHDVLHSLIEIRETLEDVLGQYPDNGPEDFYKDIESLASRAENLSDILAQSLEG